MNVQDLSAGTTAALQTLPGFRWIDGFLRFNPVLRIPLLAIFLVPISFAQMMLGADLADTLLLIAQMFMAGILLAMFVILANGAQQDLKEGGYSEAIIELVPRQKMSDLNKALLP